MPAPDQLGTNVSGYEAHLMQAALCMQATVHLAPVDCAWEYPDEKTALRGLLSSGPAIRAIQHTGEDVVREAVLNVIAPFKTDSGGYRLKNNFRYMVAKV